MKTIILPPLIDSRHSLFQNEHPFLFYSPNPKDTDFLLGCQNLNSSCMLRFTITSLSTHPVPPHRPPTHTHRVTLIFSGNGLFWVSPTAIKAITAIIEEKPRMINIFLEQNLLSLESKTKSRRQNFKKKSINIFFPFLYGLVLAIWRH